MILVRIVPPVAQDYIGRGARFQCLEPGLDGGSLVWKESVVELG